MARPKGIKPKPPCSIHGCATPAKSRGMCPMHYQRSVRGKGNMNAPKLVRPPATKPSHKSRGLKKVRAEGDRWLDSEGYVRMKISGRKTVFEHREVMAEMIGRPLLRFENVHHKNGDRADNRPANLELWSTWQPKGQRVVDKVAWAEEILAMYPSFRKRNS